LPVLGVAEIVNVVGVPAVGFEDADIETVGCCRSVTVMDAFVVDVSPEESTPVICTR
jgi:hypothetical protein